MSEKLLFISDKFDDQPHSAIDAIFKKYLPRFMDTTVLVFEKQGMHCMSSNHIVVPYHQRDTLTKKIDLNRFDYIIVRNRFDILRQILKTRNPRQKIGFQLSFPHSYRRLYEARYHRRSILRKQIEYFFKNRYEKGLIQSCDFFLPISQEMILRFFPDITIPWMALPLGIDPDLTIDPPQTVTTDTLRMVYIGTIDPLRQFNRFLSWLIPFANKQWALDIFSPHRDHLDKTLMKKLHAHIHFQGYVPRNEILSLLNRYDVGLFHVPSSDLYDVASPTKVMEYYQAGIPAWMSSIPECTELFDEESGFISTFDASGIQRSFKKILQTPRSVFHEMGRRGQRILLEKRNYSKMAEDLRNYLRKLSDGNDREERT